MSSSTVIRPLERTRYWVDDDGADATTKREDEILGYAWNLDTDGLLQSDETVSSVAYEDKGVARSGVDLTTPTISFNVTGTGETIITATLSTGRKVERVVRWYNSEGYQRGDYR